MAGPAAVKTLALEHCRRVNDGDLAGLLALYAPTVVFEDPVGSGVRTGLAALRAHAGQAIGAGVRELPGTPVGAVGGRHAAVPITGFLPYVPGSPLVAALGPHRPPPDPAATLLRMDYVMVVRAGAGGLLEDMRSYWDPADIVLVDAATAPGGAGRGR